MAERKVQVPLFKGFMASIQRKRVLEGVCMCVCIYMCVHVPVIHVITIHIML